MTMIYNTYCALFGFDTKQKYNLTCTKLHIYYIYALFMSYVLSCLAMIVCFILHCHMHKVNKFIRKQSKLNETRNKARRSLERFTAPIPLGIVFLCGSILIPFSARHVEFSGCLLLDMQSSGK